MNEFLLELYIPRTVPGAVGQARDGAHRASAELTAEGTPVRLVRSIFLPADETCLFLFEAASIDAVREAAHRAALPFEHIAEADSGESWCRDDEPTHAGVGARAPTDSTTPVRPRSAGYSNEKGRHDDEDS